MNRFFENEAVNKGSHMHSETVEVVGKSVKITIVRKLASVQISPTKVRYYEMHRVGLVLFVQVFCLNLLRVKYI